MQLEFLLGLLDVQLLIWENLRLFLHKYLTYVVALGIHPIVDGLVCCSMDASTMILAHSVAGFEFALIYLCFACFIGPTIGTLIFH